MDRNPESDQQFQDWLGKLAETHRINGAHPADKGKINIPQVMIYSTTTADPADNRYLMLRDVMKISLYKRILMFPYDYRWLILPEHDEIVGTIPQQVFLGCQVKKGVSLISDD